MKYPRGCCVTSSGLYTGLTAGGLLALLYIREEGRKQPQQGKQCADAKHKLDAGAVGQPAEKCRAYTAESEVKSEEDSGYHSHAVRLQLCGIHEDGREGRLDDESRDHSQPDGPPQADIGNEKRKRSRAQDGYPYHPFAAIFITISATHHGAYSHSRKECEETEL